MFDTQLFFVQVGFTTKDVVYRWRSKEGEEAVERDVGLSISEFDLGTIRIFEDTTIYKTGAVEWQITK